VAIIYYDTLQILDSPNVASLGYNADIQLGRGPHIGHDMQSMNRRLYLHTHDAVDQGEIGIVSIPAGLDPDHQSRPLLTRSCRPSGSSIPPRLNIYGPRNRSLPGTR
jgi:hypothetical protein